MKSQHSSNRSLRTVITDLVIYGNLAFTFVFFSAAFDRGCNSSVSATSNEITASGKTTADPLLSQKGQKKKDIIVSSQK
jgi:hypothetical protein